MKQDVKAFKDAQVTKMQILIQEVWAGTQNSALLTSSQVMGMLWSEDRTLRRKSTESQKIKEVLSVVLMSGELSTP